MNSSLSPAGPDFILMVERRLAHPPEKVWRVLTELDLLEQWFPARVDGAWDVGASLAFTFRPGEADGFEEEWSEGQVVVVQPPHLLEFRWADHTIRFEVTADGSGSVFRLSERFGDPALGAQNAAGWELCLDNLDLILEGASALKFMADAWRVKYRRYVAEFEPVFGPQRDPSGEHPLLMED